MYYLQYLAKHLLHGFKVKRRNYGLVSLKTMGYLLAFCLLSAHYSFAQTKQTTIDQTPTKTPHTLIETTVSKQDIYHKALISRDVLREFETITAEIGEIVAVYSIRLTKHHDSTSVLFADNKSSPNIPDNPTVGDTVTISTEVDDGYAVYRVTVSWQFVTLPGGSTGWVVQTSTREFLRFSEEQIK